VVTLVGALRAILLRFQRLARRVNVTRLASAVGVLLALGYADFSGGSGSAWRAAWMLVLVFIARAFERRPCPVRVFALTMLVGAVVDPLLVFDISFMLSLGATSGLLVLGRAWVARAEQIQSRPLRYLTISLAATTATMLPCTPILAVMSPELTLVGLAANVIAAPIGELVALPVCLTHAISSPLPVLETGLGLVGSGALLAVRTVAIASASVESLAFPSVDPTAWHLGLAALGAFAFLRDRLRPSEARASAFVWAATLAIGFQALEAGVRLPLRDGQTLRVSMLDVGQGDATLLELPSSQALLVDAGGFVGSPVNPGERVVLPWLRARRTERLSVVALSHPHPDHFGGLRAVVEQVEVGEFWDTGQGEAEGAGPEYAALIRALRERAVPIRRPDELCGRPRYFGAVRIDVIAPCPHFTPRRDANDNSLVLRVSYGKRRFLLTGDAEKHEEHELAERYGAALAADVLKVGHHGSRTSTTPAFLTLVQPSFATISCGVRNTFGHPHAESVATLSAARVGWLRTDRMGSLSFVTRGEQLDLYAFSFPR
ncbi:MAG TPA: DNA internalization-related competence protein ComEC/Rec2, partial [Polyangiaceae bacterium]